MKRNQNGFTLIEVLVALFIMAIMAALAWRGVDGMVHSRDISQERLDQTAKLQTAITQLEQDLAGVQRAAGLDGLQFDGATLRLTRRTGQGLQVVAWTIQPDPSGVPWRRWASPVTTRAAELRDYWAQAQRLLGNEAGTLNVLPAMSQWQVYFFRGGTWANAQSSGDLAPPPTQGASAPPQTQLPLGVRIVLGFAPRSGQTGNLTREMRLGP